MKSVRIALLLAAAALALPAAATPPAPSTLGPTLHQALQPTSGYNTFYDPLLWGTTANPGVVTIVGNTLSNIDPGWPSQATLTLNAADPSTTNTMTLTGAPPNTAVVETYEFLTAGGTVANDNNIGVVRGVSKQATLTALILAINGGVTSPTGLLKSTGAAARRNGTKYYVASDLTGVVMEIRSASGVGGTPIARADTTTLSETFTDAADIWDVGSGNPINPGHAATITQAMCQSRVVTASHLLTATKVMRFSFVNNTGAITIGRATAAVYGSTGIRKYPIADTLTVSGSDALYTLAGTGAPEAIAGDTIIVTAWAQ